MRFCIPETLAVLVVLLPGDWIQAAPARDFEAPDSPLTLWYRQPASKWVEALPVGNGRLGAMIFGRTDRERLQLNVDTLWDGYPLDPSNPGNPPSKLRANIRADARSQFKHVQFVFDACVRNGIYKTSLAATPDDPR